MSLESRCQQFHQAAVALCTPPSPDSTVTIKKKNPQAQAAKEITTLRKFLHRNQDQRFTDKATARLMECLQLYAHASLVGTELKEGLLEDALKLPFTVLGTKQKQKLLKWLEELRGTTIGGGGAALSAAVVLSVIDMTDEQLDLMEEDTGDTHEIPKSAIPPTLWDGIRQAFDTSEETVGVRVTWKDPEANNKEVDRVTSLEP